MKKHVLFVVLQLIWMTGFAENLRFKEFGTPIPARANLDVRWNAPTNALPPRIWVCRLLPRDLSPQIMSNLMAACSFTDKDKVIQGDMLAFNSLDGSRQLRVVASRGIIDYEMTIHRSMTNFVKNVPSERKTLKLAKKFLPELGIDLADIDKKENSFQSDFHVFDTGVVYFINHKAVTNTESRGIRFRRAVNGISFISIGTGGDGEIHFGDHGRISKIDVSWRHIEPSKLYATVTPETIVRSLRGGKAVQGFTLESLGDIDWSRVKSVTIKKVFPRYYAGGGRLAPSDWLYPFAALWTTVDTSHGNIDVEIDCPIIDETTP